MAVATTTAIAAATSLAGAGLSFARSIEEQRKIKEAGEAAARYMDDARKQFSVNFAEQLQVPLEGYQMAAEMNTQAVAQALEAMRESGQRSIIGGVAGLQQQAQAGAEQLRMSLQQDLYQRDKMVADEESRLRDIQAEIDVAEATGAQQAAADAELRRAAAIESGIGSLAQAGSTIFEGSQLYKQTQGADLANKFGEGLTGQQKSNLADKFSSLSKGQRKFLEQADPSLYSPFLQTSGKLLTNQRSAVSGIKSEVKRNPLNLIPLPKINFPK
jgi:hypothetical protein